MGIYIHKGCCPRYMYHLLQNLVRECDSIPPLFLRNFFPCYHRFMIGVATPFLVDLVILSVKRGLGVGRGGRGGGGWGGMSTR